MSKVVESTWDLEDKKIKPLYELSLEDVRGKTKEIQEKTAELQNDFRTLFVKNLDWLSYVSEFDKLIERYKELKPLIKRIMSTPKY